VFVEHASIATDIFLDHAKSGKSIDAQQLMFNFTMDGIGQIGFGQKFGNLEGLKTGGVQFGKSFDVAVALSTQRYINPGYLTQTLTLTLSPNPNSNPNPKP
jgi:hypothetical protein